MGRLEHLLPAAFLYLPTGCRVPSFYNLCWTIHFFQPFPVLSSPWSPCGCRRSCLAQCFPTSGTPCPWWGPRDTCRSQVAGSSGCSGTGAAAVVGPPMSCPRRRHPVLALCSMSAEQCCSSWLWRQRKPLSITAAKLYQSTVLSISDDQRLMDPPAAGEQPQPCDLRSG